jgi:hypothetical protein
VKIYIRIQNDFGLISKAATFYAIACHGDLVERFGEI